MALTILIIVLYYLLHKLFMLNSIIITCLCLLKVTQFFKNKLKTINYLNNMYKIGKQSSDG